MPQPGELIHGKYRILKQLADGGMGTIYEARHEVLGTTVALKMLHPNLAKRSNLAERFLQEARVSATLRSPHIVQVLDVEQGPQGAMLVMELLRGETLQALLERQQRLDVPTAIDHTLQILAGLEVAHAANVVHRDLKPDNVFLVAGPSGPLLKLLDFGIAKLKTSPEFDRGLTRPGVVMGTPEYMAPEQAYSADTVDARADIYAMGVLLFEMLSGQRPIRGDDPKTIAQKVFSGHVTALSALLPSLPMGLVSAVHRAMAPAPKGRFSSVAELRQALLPFAGPGSTAVLNPAGLPTLPAPTQPNPGPMPSHPPNGPATPPLPHATPPGPSQPSYPSYHQGSQPSAAPQPSYASQPPQPSYHQGSQPSYHQGSQPSPAPQPSYASHPGVPPATPTGAPAPVWPGGSMPQTVPPDPYGSTEARSPLPQAFSPSPAPTHLPANPPWGAPHASTAPAQPLPQSTVLPENPYGSTGIAPTYDAPAGGTAVGAVYNPQEFPTATPPPQPFPMTQPMAPRRKGAPVGLIAVLAVLAGGLAVVFVLLLRGHGDDDPEHTPKPPPTVPAVTATATATATAPGLPTALPLPTLPTQPTTQPPSQPGTQPATKPPPRDAGADGATEAGTGLFGLPSSLPLPPMPSAMPPIPSGLPLPQFPGFPGWQ